MIEIQQRTQRTAESILDNEALTADLEDDAAKLLLDWGVKHARQIAGQTIEMDDSQAEDAMYQPMRALRKMLRSANKWANGPGEKNLRRILKEAPSVYGSGYTQPGDEDIRIFMTQIPPNPSERVTALQRFVEGKPFTPVESEERTVESDTKRDIVRRASHRKINPD